MKIAEGVAVSNINESDVMEIAKFKTYQQAFIEVKQILEMSADMSSEFAALPKITKEDDGWFLVSLTVKKRK